MSDNYPEPVDPWDDLGDVAPDKRPEVYTGPRIPVGTNRLDQDTLETLSEEQFDAYLAYTREVRRQAETLRIRQAARDFLAAEEAAANPAPPFDAGTVRDILARPAPAPFRAKGLIPSEAGVLVVAARKTGKTTLMLNYARALLTGEDFLGRFPVTPLDPDGIVSLLNYEVSGDTLARWADEHDIDPDRLYLVNLRGRRNPLAHPEDRARLANDIASRNTRAIICDPFGRAFTGKSQNDPGEVGSWLVDLDLFARGEAGATEVMLTAHAGWNGERSRGSSALEDWADVNIWLTRDADDDTKRFLRAEGRDVLVDEDQLLYDESTRTLSLAGTGSRKKSRDERNLSELAVFVIRAARQEPGAHLAALEALVKKMDDAPSFRNGDVSKAAKYAREQGQLSIVSGGPGRKSQHFPTDTHPNPSPSAPGDAPQTPPTPPYRGGVGVESQSDHSLIPPEEIAS